MKNKIMHLEGLRGIAALVVVFSHLQLALFIEIDTKVDQYLSFSSIPLGNIFRALHDGDFSVWLFWVMSSFALSIGYFKKKQTSATEAQIYLTKSAIKRYFRLAPPVIISALFAYALMKLNLITNNELAQALGEQYTNGWLGSFYSFEASFTNVIRSAALDSFFNFKLSETYNAVLWTMEAEFLGSLFIFAMLALFAANKMRLLINALVLLITLHYKAFWLSAFLIGTILADIYVTHHNNLDKYMVKSKLASVLALIILLILIGLPNIGGYLHLILASVFIIVTLYFSSFITFLSTKPLVTLGKLSFSLYLVHLPIICSFTGWLYLTLAEHLTHGQNLAITALLTCILSLVCSIPIYYLGDKLGVNLSNAIARKYEDKNLT